MAATKFQALKRRVEAEPLPVSTLDDALRWLIVHTNCEDWIFDPEADLPQAAKFACDMFWISPAHLCKKLRALWPAILVETRVQRQLARYHRHRGR